MGACAFSSCGKTSEESKIKINYPILAEKIKRGNLIKTFNFDEMGLESLKILDNHLEKSISVFSAQNNRLTAKGLPRNFFKNLEKVTKIDFSKNKFTYIDEVILNLSQLVILDFSHNLIDQISPDIKNMMCLRDLDLSHNNILELPKEFKELPNLETLNLSYNVIDIFKNEIILNLPKLETLNISYNSIDCLGNDYWAVTKLKNLEVSFNKLKHIPNELLQKSNISNLNLKGNKISRLEFLKLDGYPEFEKRRKERKDQAFYNNLEIGFDMCGLE
jgi:Leucine-rich repeat (LRR) protein